MLEKKETQKTKNKRKVRSKYKPWSVIFEQLLKLRKVSWRSPDRWANPLSVMWKHFSRLRWANWGKVENKARLWSVSFWQWPRSRCWIGRVWESEFKPILEADFIVQPDFGFFLLSSIKRFARRRAEHKNSRFLAVGPEWQLRQKFYVLLQP